MDEARIKRLAWTLGISIILILLLKAVLLNTATKVGEAKLRTEKSHQVAPPASAANPPPQPVILPEAETPADSMNSPGPGTDIPAAAGTE